MTFHYVSQKRSTEYDMNDLFPTVPVLLKLRTAAICAKTKKYVARCYVEQGDISDSNILDSKK